MHDSVQVGGMSTGTPGARALAALPGNPHEASARIMTDPRMIISKYVVLSLIAFCRSFQDVPLKVIGNGILMVGGELLLFNLKMECLSMI